MYRTITRDPGKDNEADESRFAVAQFIQKDVTQSQPKGDQ